MSEANNKSDRLLPKQIKLACVLTLSFILYACSILPARFAVLCLDRWGLIKYRPVNNALNRFYAPVLWVDDHLPVIQDVGMAADKKMRSLVP
jgi:hypothetical protein